MTKFLRWLFGFSVAHPSTPLNTQSDGTPARPLLTGPLDARASGDHNSTNLATDRADGDPISRYFELSAAIERGKADRDFLAATRAARETHRILPAVVRRWMREYGSWDIATSRAVHTGGTFMAVLGDREGIRELRSALESIPQLRDWIDAVEQAESDAALVDGIMAAITASPGLLQSDLKVRVSCPDGRRLSMLASWLEKARRIQRVRTGSTYKLFPAGFQVAPSPQLAAAAGGSAAVVAGQSVIPAVRSLRRRSAKPAGIIELQGLPYVRLPMAPPYWKERRAQEDVRASEVPEGESPIEPRPTSRPAARFAVEGAGWFVASEERLTPAQKPNPAYKDVFATSGSTFWLDAKGRREGFEYALSVLRVTDRSGQVTAEKGLPFDVYRSDVNTDGSAILFLSRDGVLHAYSDRLEPLLADRFEEVPEYRVQAERLSIEPSELRNHVRCVGISADRTRYLVTVVDEAWCFSTTTDEPLWGLRMPTQEGWTRAAAPRSERSGSSADIGKALRLMGLELPLTPDILTQQYRRLASRWHPDRNLGDPTAVPRMQELNAAMELLTGTDVSGLGGREVEQVAYEKVLHRTSVDAGHSHTVEMSFGLVASEKTAADWIYAANFASSDNRVYLASYSGKIVEVSEEGIPVRTYDIGAVPRHIAETESHLYLLTDTRLYVLEGDRLHALVDVFDAGDLLIAELGFGLLETKSFTWFSPSGRSLGAVRTKEPIRRVLTTPAGLIIETRQHRATVGGAPSWWRN